MWPYQEHADLSGADFADDEVARSYALQVIDELKRDDGFDHPGLKVVVKNEKSETLFSVLFQTIQ